MDTESRIHPAFWGSGATRYEKSEQLSQQKVSLISLASAFPYCGLGRGIVGSAGFSWFPSPHSLVGSDGSVPKSIVPTVRGSWLLVSRLVSQNQSCRVGHTVTRCRAQWGSGHPRSRSPDLRNDPGTVTIPQYRFNKNKATHMMNFVIDSPAVWQHNKPKIKNQLFAKDSATLHIPHTPWQTIQKSLGCTPLFPSPKSVRLWGVHRHRTGWRLVGVPFRSTLQTV